MIQVTMMADARLLLPFIAIALLLLPGCENGTAAVPEPSGSASKAAESSGPPEPVLVGQPVRKTLILNTTQPARIEAFESTPLFAKVSGYVEEVLVDIGDRVEKGQELVRLSVPELEDDRRQREALVAQAKAELKQAQAAQTATEAALVSSQAAIEQAKAGTARSEAEYERWRAESARLDSLAAAGSVTQKVADETRNQLRSADAARQEVAATVRAAEAAANQAQADIEKAKADVVAAEARLAVAEANLARSDTMLRYTRIVSPFAGVITERRIDTGHFVAQEGNDRPLLSVDSRDRVRVFLNIPEMEATKVDVGDPATVRIQALEGTEAKGEVTRTAWALDHLNRSLRTEVDLANPEGQFRPGMYATVMIELAQRENVLALPVAAILRSSEGTYCFVVQDGKAIRTPITLGLRVGGEFEILAGLSGDEKVALTKADSLQDGQAVEPLAP